MLSSRPSRTALFLCASALASLGLAAGASAASKPKLSISQFTEPNGPALQDSTLLQMGTIENSGSEGTAIVRVSIDGKKVATVKKRVKADGRRKFDVDVPVSEGVAAGTHLLQACLAKNAAPGAECSDASNLKVVAKDEIDDPPAPKGAQVCTSGPRTLGDRNFPEHGNGGYDVQHYDLFFNYDSANNELLGPADSPTNPTHVAATIESTQDLCDFALDFNMPESAIDGVTINGDPVTWDKWAPPGGAQPCPVSDPTDTCAPSGRNPGGVPYTYPAPDGCSPSVNNPPNPLATGPTELHNQCPEMKLVITPDAPIADGEEFVVDVAYHGTPGIHYDPDGAVEGWAPTFTSVPAPGTPDGAYVVNEPVGAFEWFPGNDHPQDKATYDFRLTVPAGKTALGNGELLYYTDNPDTTRTWRWEMGQPMETAMSTTTSGTFDLTGTVANNGVQYYNALDSTFTPTQKSNANVQINQHSAITNYLTDIYGRYPFDSGGVVADNTSGSDINYVLEVQTKIHFPSSNVSLGTLVHETGHMWFGDAVSPVEWNHIWLNEGWATYSSYDYTAFQLNGTALATQFNNNYTAGTGTACTPPATGTNKWCIAPLEVDGQNTFNTFPTYTRHAIMLVALRQILGSTRFYNVAESYQEEHRGSTMSFGEYKQLILREACRGALGFTGTELGKLEIFLNQWLAGTDITAPFAFGNPKAPTITGTNFFPVDPATPPAACPSSS